MRVKNSGKMMKEIDMGLREEERKGIWDYVRKNGRMQHMKMKMKAAAKQEKTHDWKRERASGQNGATYGRLGTWGKRTHVRRNETANRKERRGGETG